MMKIPNQQPKQKIEQEPQKIIAVSQKKQANGNPFLPNNNNNKPNNNPFNNNNKNGGNPFVVSQMKTAQNVVQMAGGNTQQQRPPSRQSQRRRPAPPLVAMNGNFNALKDTNTAGGQDAEQAGFGDGLDYAEDSFGASNDALGVMGDHNDTQKLIAETELAKGQGGGSIDNLSDDDKDNAETGKEVTFKGQDTLAGVSGTIGGLLTMGSAFKAWGDSEDNWDKAGAVLQGAGGVADVVSNIAGLLGADKISAIADSVSAGIGAVKSTLEVIKGLKELKDFEGDKKEKGMEVAKSASEGLKKGFEATKKMMQAVGSIAPSAVTQAIPVLSIIFSAIEIIQEAMELVQAVKNYRMMGEEKTNLKQDADASYFSKTEKRGFIGFRKEKQVTDKNKLEQVKAGNIGDSSMSADRKKELAEKAKNFDMVRSLKKINKERIVRSATNIGLNVVGIIGDIVTLTGVGAPVGVIIKAGAGAVKGGLKLFRGAKQLYNNIRGNENSSTNQHKKRMEQVKFIFSLVKSMTAFPTTTDAGRNKANAMGDRISKYVGAMGTDITTFVKYKTEPDKAIKLLYSALKKRESSDKVEAK